ncbi:MAG TPA: DUF4345 domain-containing protein [Hyphomicrobiaceae bacterium]|nr:DUF4345 domain-containing protein [Hyphomicrobiaceae bacterium]
MMAPEAPIETRGAGTCCSSGVEADMATNARERRLLQVALFFAGAVPVAAGLAGIILGGDLLSVTAVDAISADSHIRYLSGLLLGIGLCAWTTLPNIETAGKVLRALIFAVLIGGLARLWSWIGDGAPAWPMLFGLVMELVVAPALALWQWCFVRRLSVRRTT